MRTPSGGPTLNYVTSYVIIHRSGGDQYSRVPPSLLLTRKSKERRGEGESRILPLPPDMPCTAGYTLVKSPYPSPRVGPTNGHWSTEGRSGQDRPKPQPTSARCRRPSVRPWDVWRLCRSEGRDSRSKNGAFGSRGEV